MNGPQAERRAATCSVPKGIGGRFLMTQISVESIMSVCIIQNPLPIRELSIISWQARYGNILTVETGEDARCWRRVFEAEEAVGTTAHVKLRVGNTSEDYFDKYRRKY
jgi:hypothetical protein